MNKILLTLLCLTIVSIGIACVSAADNATMAHDFIQAHDSQNINIDANLTVEKDVADNGTADADTTPHDDAMPADNVTGNHTATGNNTPKLDIKGPKNDSGLKLKCPKGNPTLDQKGKDIFHCAKVFSVYQFWDLDGCLKYAFDNLYKKNHYSWKDIATIVAKAHNTAYCKKSKYHYDYYTINKELTPDEVYNHILSKSYLYHCYYGRNWG